MQKQTLTISIPIPDGHEIDTLDKVSRTVTLKPIAKKPMERIKTVADLLADHGFTQAEFDRLTANLDSDEKSYRILKMLATSLNEGWTPDWNNDNQYKYYPWFEMVGSSGFRFYDCGDWYSRSGVGSRLAFKSSELAEYAGKNFTEVYKQFMLISQ
jgi:hypothetical protein